MTRRRTCCALTELAYLCTVFYTIYIISTLHVYCTLKYYLIYVCTMCNDYILIETTKGKVFFLTKSRMCNMLSHFLLNV